MILFRWCGVKVAYKSYKSFSGELNSWRINAKSMKKRSSFRVKEVHHYQAYKYDSSIHICLKFIPKRKTVNMSIFFFDFSQLSQHALKTRVQKQSLFKRDNHRDKVLSSTMFQQNNATFCLPSVHSDIIQLFYCQVNFLESLTQLDAF